MSKQQRENFISNFDHNHHDLNGDDHFKSFEPALKKTKIMKDVENDLFPNDVLYEILNFHRNDFKFIVLSCALVSKQWLQVSSERWKFNLKYSKQCKLKGQFLQNIDSFQVMDYSICFDCAQLVSMKRLRHFELGTKIEGLEHICELNQLEELSICTLDSVDRERLNIRRLKKLTKLRLSPNFSDRDVECLSELEQLTSLNIRFNNLIGKDGIKHVCKLKNLIELDTRNTSICSESFKYISEMKQLTSLDIGGNMFESCMYLTKLSQLKKLGIRENGIGDEGLKYISQLKQLTVLDVYFNDIGTEGAKYISEMKKLTRLNIADNKLVEAGVKYICNLENLIHLNISCNEIGYGVKYLSALKHLRKLKIHNCKINSTTFLSQLTQLHTLEMFLNDIGDEYVTNMIQMNQLTKLDITSNRITSKGAKLIGRMTNLKELNISYNELGDEGCRYITELYNLTKLSISSNNITDEGCKALSQMKRLEYLVINWNMISKETEKFLVSEIPNLLLQK